MAPQAYSYNYNQPPPPAYNYQAQQPYHHDQQFHPQPPYQHQQPYRQEPYTPHHRSSPRSNCAIQTAHQFALVIPGIIIILNIWWAATQRVCPNNADVGNACFRVLWYSIPIAIVTFFWGIATNISHRRQHRRMKHIPKRISALALLILAIGSTTCFALLVVHMQDYNIWGRSAESAMATLLALLMIVNWALFGWTAYELIRERRAARHSVTQVPI